ncbi:MAG: N-6 DNA methylase [Candidatus Heimdallarchaeota archaeon]|nr:N-6 DNA methylase [Candidatus Heimdallarchaeota archaeon]
MISPNRAKKQTGAFYTPSFIVDFMVERVFYHLKTNNLLAFDSFRDFQSSILKLRFCDPAIGSGNFIVGLLNKLNSILIGFDSVDNEEKNEFFHHFASSNIYGIELDQGSLDTCKNILKEQYSLLKNSDFPNLKCGNSIVSLDAFDILGMKKAKKLNPFSWKDNFGENNKFDVIIGNPPYFNLKKMVLVDEDAQILYDYLKSSHLWKNFFRSSSDIYYYFVKQSIDMLNVGGIFSFIIPNYWIENKYADKLREDLLKRNILEIIDLEGNKIFKDEGKWLNISTCILTLEESRPSQTFPAVKNFFIESTVQKEKINELFNEQLFPNKQSYLGKEKWIISPYNEYLRSLETNTSMEKLGNISKVFQGLSPGVKDIFVIPKSKVTQHSIESDVLVPFVTNSDVQKWFIREKVEKQAILPSKIDSLENYPNTNKYLLSNKERLKSGPDRQKLMKSGQIRWFDYSVYRNLDLFLSKEKRILCPYRSLTTKFALDENGSFAATDIYAIIPVESTDIYSILGILNSEFINFWYSLAGKRKGRMLEFFSNPLKKIPIPRFEIRDVITPLVKELLKIVEKSDESDDDEVKVIEDKLNFEISKMYDFDFRKLGLK